MKVILLQDVAKIGRRSEIVEVPDGYALNQLIPKRMAEPASAVNTKKIERLQAEAAATTEANKANFKEALAKLRDSSVSIAAETNEKGHTFRAISSKEVVVSAKEVGVILDEKMIVFDSPIKEVGEHLIYLVLGKDKGDFKINVVKK